MPNRGEQIGSIESVGGKTKAARAFVRITGMHLGRFLEFDFSLNDQDLTVQLVMPAAAFEEFCAAHEAEILPPTPEAAAVLAGTGPAGMAGLYRPPPSGRDDGATGS